MSADVPAADVSMVRPEGLDNSAYEENTDKQQPGAAEDGGGAGSREEEDRERGTRGTDAPRAGGNMEESRPLSARKKKSGYWKRLKKKWNRKGVVEIDIDHHRHSMLEGIREGLTQVLNNPALGLKDELRAQDYEHTYKTTLRSSKGKRYEFCSYASPVFAALRHALGLDEQEFIESVAPASDDQPYLEFMSNSHGGQHFYLTNDKAYFMKTDTPKAINFFQSILGKYLEHFLKYPHSLIVKYLGLYSIKGIGAQEKSTGGVRYFYVMQSIFFPEERIEERYDLKGSLCNRYQKPPPPGSDAICILKDRNFLNEQLVLGNQAEWFLNQLEYDVGLLRSLGVQDYSLLVGRHPLQPDETRQDLADVVTRVKRSVNLSKVRTLSFDHNLGAAVPSRTSVVTAPVNLAPTEEYADESDSTTPAEDDISSTGHGLGIPRRHTQMTKRTSFLDTRSLDQMGALNRRLLPKCQNPLHIIDGPQTRYHIGIIDFFTTWQCKQRCARVLKNVRFCCGNHSTVPPDQYAERFKLFIHDHVV